MVHIPEAIRWNQMRKQTGGKGDRAIVLCAPTSGPISLRKLRLRKGGVGNRKNRARLRSVLAV